MDKIKIFILDPNRVVDASEAPKTTGTRMAEIVAKGDFHILTAGAKARMAVVDDLPAVLRRHVHEIGLNYVRDGARAASFSPILPISKTNARISKRGQALSRKLGFPVILTLERPGAKSQVILYPTAIGNVRRQRHVALTLADLGL